MRSRSLILVLLGIAVVGVGAAASPGAWSSQLVAPTVVVLDKAGDAQDGNYKRYPRRGDIDIRRVEVTKLSGGLRIAIQTAAPARSGDNFSFFYYRPDGNGGGIIQTRYRSDGTISTDANVNPNQAVSYLPASSTRFNGNRLILYVPNRYLDPGSRFKWMTSTGLIGAALDITDEAPNQGASTLNPKLARYP